MGCDGNVSEVAAILHAHKHTVRYRLRRVTELTGLDVTSFEDAAQPYLAVRATEVSTLLGRSPFVSGNKRSGVHSVPRA